MLFALPEKSNYWMPLHNSRFYSFHRLHLYPFKWLLQFNFKICLLVFIKIKFKLMRATSSYRNCCPVSFGQVIRFLACIRCSFLSSFSPLLLPGRDSSWNFIDQSNVASLLNCFVPLVSVSYFPETSFSTQWRVWTLDEQLAINSN